MLGKEGRNVLYFITRTQQQAVYRQPITDALFCAEACRNKQDLWSSPELVKSTFLYEIEWHIIGKAEFTALFNLL